MGQWLLLLFSDLFYFAVILFLIEQEAHAEVPTRKYKTRFLPEKLKCLGWLLVNILHDKNMYWLKWNGSFHLTSCGPIQVAWPFLIFCEWLPIFISITKLTVLFYFIWFGLTRMAIFVSWKPTNFSYTAYGNLNMLTPWNKNWSLNFIFIFVPCLSLSLWEVMFEYCSRSIQRPMALCFLSSPSLGDFSSTSWSGVKCLLQKFVWVEMFKWVHGMLTIVSWDHFKLGRQGNLNLLNFKDAVQRHTVLMIFLQLSLKIFTLKYLRADTYFDQGLKEKTSLMNINNATGNSSAQFKNGNSHSPDCR